MESVELTSPRIRRAHPSDVPALAVLGRETFWETHREAAYREVLEDYLDRAFDPAQVARELADAANVFHVSEQGGRLIGYSKVSYDVACPLPSPFARTTKLERLYFSSRAHGSGQGRAMLEHLRRLALAHGQQAMWLTVWVGNAQAIGFYEHLGFANIGETYFQVSPTVRDLNYVMLAPLNPPSR